jgi:hypothetical protein
MLSQPKDPSSRVPRRRSRTPAGPKHQRHAQAVLSLGGTVHCQSVLGNGAYYLIDEQEPRKNKADNSDKKTERPWNVNHLRPFFC